MPRASSIVRSLLPCDMLHEFMCSGLDVPSSGLILAAKTYGAYFNLRLQLETGTLRGHGL